MDYHLYTQINTVTSVVSWERQKTLSTFLHKHGFPRVSLALAADPNFPVKPRTWASSWLRGSSSPHRSLHVSSPSCLAHSGGASAAAEAVSNLFRTSAPALTAGLFAPKVSSSPLVLPVWESSLLKADWMMAPPSFPSFLLTRGFSQPGPSHSADAPPLQHTGARRTAGTAPGGHLGPWAFAHANGLASHPLASSPETFP